MGNFLNIKIPLPVVVIIVIIIGWLLSSFIVSKYEEILEVRYQVFEIDY